jgi:hypothetical protein
MGTHPSRRTGAVRVNCRHLSPRGWRHTSKTPGWWYCATSGQQVTPGGGRCNKHCRDYDDPQEAAMGAQKVQWDADVSTVIHGAESGQTVEEWAVLQRQAGFTQEHIGEQLGVTGGAVYLRLKQRREAEAEKPRPVPKPEPVAVLDAHRPITCPGEACLHADLDEQQEPCASCSQVGRGPDDHFERAAPLEDDSDADLPVEGPEPSPELGPVKIVEVDMNADALHAYVSALGLTRDAQVFCLGYNAGRRDAA